MRAVWIEEHGGPEVLRYGQREDPRPGRGEVLVKVLAASVNHLDLWVRRGMPGFKVDFPRILGCDGTGEVLELGAEVSGLAPGQRVLLEPGYTDDPESEAVKMGEDNLAPDYKIRGEHCNGFDAELVVLAARFCRPLPEDLDPVLTAATPLVWLTAWGMLMERARIRRGETVLVLGAGSGVGSAAIQIAREAGCRVLSTAREEGSRALGKELGASEVLDHGNPDWPKEVRALTDGAGADVVVEHVGPATWPGSLRALAHCGRLVTCGGTTGPEVKVLLPHLFIKQQSILGSTMGPRNSFPILFERLRAGTFRPIVDRVLPLSEARQAHDLLEARGVRGKIVLVP